MTEEWIEEVVKLKKERTEKERRWAELEIEEAALIEDNLSELWNGIKASIKEAVDSYNQALDSDQQLAFNTISNTTFSLGFSNSSKGFGAVLEAGRKRIYCKYITGSRDNEATFNFRIVDGQLRLFSGGSKPLEPEEIAKEFLYHFMKEL